MDNKPKIEAIPEVIADTRRLCEIRFDCMVTMYDVAYRKRDCGVFGEEVSKTPQWFKAQHQLSLESIKYMDEYSIGATIKEMFYQLEKTINKYEQPR